MSRRIFSSMMTIALATVLLFSILLLIVLYNFFSEQVVYELGNELEAITIAAETDIDTISYLKALSESEAYDRLTWINAEGTVIYDSASDAVGMENHLTRPEIALALKNGYGSSTRYSSTLGERTINSARLLSDGSIIRLSSARGGMFGILRSIIIYFVLVILLTAGVSAFVAKRVTKRIVEPINKLDLSAPSANQAYKELEPLLARMNEQKESIDSYVSELTMRQAEFSAITENMAEGLIVLNSQLEIVLINKSAKRLLGEGEANNEVIFRAAQTALTGQPVSEVLELSGSYYQLLANTVMDGDIISGTVVLLLDITDKYLSEQTRREFSANVSHELKTPLTAIRGYAEIMQNGIAPAENLREFAGRIHLEAMRLIKLVEDILHLSRLDEKQTHSDFESVSLYKLCEEAAKRLSEYAEECSVSLNVSGEDISIDGVKHILDEMIYNLIDNAIKYNVEGGRVDVNVAREGEIVALTVADTGIGIPEQYHERIFERFFCVDKSHSKEIGGTGLGLSIVKHAAIFHGAEIRLVSAPNKGTSISVLFK